MDDPEFLKAGLREIARLLGPTEANRKAMGSTTDNPATLTADEEAIVKAWLEALSRLGEIG